MPPEETIREIVREEIASWAKGFEERLTDAMTKALDTVEHENRERIRSLEEDMAQVLRKVGGSSDG